MPIRKKGNVEIQASASGTKVKQTSYTFYSYDKKSAALYFQFREQDGQPTDLGKATVHLVMILNDDNGKKFIPGDNEIEVLSAIRGTAKYVLPDNLLGYEGKVTSYVYLDFSDGSHTDEGHFAFEIKRSLITDVIPEAGDKYVQDFEDIKAEVQEAADVAKETISQKATEVSDTSDSAISKVNQTADDTIKTASEARNDIETNVSGVQSKASEAEKEIGSLVESTESARDEAVKTMNELDSDRNLLLDSGIPIKNDEYRMATYTLTEKLIEGETYTVTIKGKLAENKSWFGIFIGSPDNQTAWLEDKGGGYYRTTFKGRSEDIGKEKILIFAYPRESTAESSIEWIQLNHGPLAPEDIVTQDQYSKLENAITNLGRNLFSVSRVTHLAFGGASSSGELLESSGYKGYTLPVSKNETYSISRDSLSNNRFRVAYTKSDPKDGMTYFHSTSNKYDEALKIEGLVVPEEAKYMVIYFSNQNDELPNIKLNYGTRAAPWTPAPEDIALKSEIEQIKQAITNLGGSV